MKLYKLIKKQYFTLLEVCISLVLISIIITTVFRFFYNITKLEKNLKIAKEEILFKNFLHIKLNDLFSKISQENFCFFYDETKNALYFSYDNKIDPNPKFCKTSIAKLFLNNNNLTLHLTCKDTLRKEILATNIKNLQFMFIKKNKTTKKWKKEKKNLPFMLNIKLKTLLKNKKYKFSVFPFYKNSSIAYLSKKK